VSRCLGYAVPRWDIKINEGKNEERDEVFFLSYYQENAQNMRDIHRQEGTETSMIIPNLRQYAHRTDD
jgi:hypothetical protein